MAGRVKRLEHLLARRIMTQEGKLNSFQRMRWLQWPPHRAHAAQTSRRNAVELPGARCGGDGGRVLKDDVP